MSRRSRCNATARASSGARRGAVLVTCGRWRGAVTSSTRAAETYDDSHNGPSFNGLADPLEQSRFREAHVAIAPDDHVVVDGEVEQAAGVDQLPRHGPVIRRGRRVAARVVV